MRSVFVHNFTELSFLLFSWMMLVMLLCSLEEARKHLLRVERMALRSSHRFMTWTMLVVVAVMWRTVLVTMVRRAMVRWWRSMTLVRRRQRIAAPRSIQQTELHIRCTYSSGARKVSLACSSASVSLSTSESEALTSQANRRSGAA